jgi:hypothetical protein
MLVQQNVVAKPKCLPKANFNFSKKTFGGFLALALMSVISQNVLAKNSVKAAKIMSQAYYTQKLEDIVSVALQSKIKAGQVSVERDDIADDEINNKAEIKATGINARMTKLTINNKAEITGIKCQTFADFAQYEGLSAEAVSEIDATKYLEFIKPKLSQRLYGSFINELLYQKINLSSIQAKLGESQIAKILPVKKAMNHAQSLGVSEMHLCFADIYETTDLSEATDLRFTIMIPLSIINATDLLPLTLSEFGFSHQQLAKEKAEDNKNLTVPASSSGI